MTLTATDLQNLDAPALRELLMQWQQQSKQELQEWQEQSQKSQQELRHKQAWIDKLTFENAMLKRLKFAAQSERYSSEQRRLWEDTFDADQQAVTEELEQLQAPSAHEQVKQQPKRQALPAQLPRQDIHHELEDTQCACGCEMKRVGQDVAERLDYTPGVFKVERHIRGKWACAQCQTLRQAPVPAHIIDKGLPTAGLLAQVLVAKYADHLPLYRQESIYARAGVPLARSTLAQWVGSCGVQLQPLVDALRQVMLEHQVLHADETPLAMLDPTKGKTHRAYLWAYATSSYAPVQGVIYDFCESRAGEHPRKFLGDWQGSLVCDDYAGYKQLFTQEILEVGCLAHARRKFFELHTSNQSPMAQTALDYIAQIYEIEREVQSLPAHERQAQRQQRSQPILDAWLQWMKSVRQKIPDSSSSAKALDYSLKRYPALSRFAQDGQLPVDNNHLENRIRPIAIGRNNWLFAGSLRAGRRAAAIISLIQSARLNGLDPYAYLRDVLQRLPTHPNSHISELLPHRWVPASE